MLRVMLGRAAHIKFRPNPNAEHNDPLQQPPKTEKPKSCYWIFNCRYLLPCSMRCAFRDGVLHTPDVVRGFFWVTVIGLSSWTSLAILLSTLASIRHFLAGNCWYLDFFLLFGYFSVNPRDGCASVLGANPLATRHSKSLQTPFFSQSVWTKCHELLPSNWLIRYLQLTAVRGYLINWPVSYIMASENVFNSLSLYLHQWKIFDNPAAGISCFSFSSYWGWSIIMELLVYHFWRFIEIAFVWEIL